MPLQEHIQSKAGEHTQLLQSIAGLDYAPAALEQQTAYLKELRKEITQVNQDLKQLEGKTKIEKTEWEKLRDSSSKRLAHKLTGRKEKYHSKTEKEEREYLEALQNENNARDKKAKLDKDEADAVRTNQDLTNAVKQHDDLKGKLTALYNSVFDGPTPELAEEDHVEISVKNMELNYNQAQMRLNTESQVAAIINDVERQLAMSLQSLDKALEYSRADMWGMDFGGYTDIKERSALSKAQGFASTAEMLMNQAHSLAPNAVRPLGQIQIAQGNFFSDVVFDNIFTDAAMHDKIKSSRMQVQQKYSEIRSQLEEANKRVDQLGMEVGKVSEQLHNARKELHQMRESVFNNMSGAAPPAYNPPAQQQQQQPQQQQSSTNQSQSSTSQRGGQYGGENWGSNNPYAFSLAERGRAPTDPVEQSSKQ